jgi:hypothetical protein
MKQISFIIFILIPVLLFAGNPPTERARGIFTAFGVGPRMPLSTFSGSTDMGYGINIEISYTDNEYLPFFLFSKVGFEQYPGSQGFYEVTAYSNYSTTSIPVNLGARYYLAPMLENVVLFMPFFEMAASFNFYSILHQFKIGTGRSNYTSEVIKLGFSGGMGISMFLMEVLASYNYFENNQFIAIDLKVRLPLYIIY